MQKTILITGATDGIGLATAQELVTMGQSVLLHGRDSAKLAAIASELSSLPGQGKVDSYIADLSVMSNVETLAQEVATNHQTLDVLINNAGVFCTNDPITPDGLDVRFVVNTIAPYLLTQRLLPLLGDSGRVINLSSAAQSSVDLSALTGTVRLPDREAYAQSKLALTMWSRCLALSIGKEGPAIVAVNPGSLLASKMVNEAFGIAGKDIQIGVDVLARAALSEEFASASGKYFDNDAGRFAAPHEDALDDQRCEEIVRTIEGVLAR